MTRRKLMQASRTRSPRAPEPRGSRQVASEADGFDLATEMPQELFAVGSVCSVRKSAIKMRKEEDLASAVIKDIPGPNQGLNAARLLVLKRGAEGRLQVQDSHGDVGWVSSTSTEGRRLLQPSSAWLLGDDLESSRAAVQELWRSQVRAQEEGGDFVSEMLAAHHCALENDARRWRLVQEVEDVKQELEDEEETCKASVKKLRAELKLQEAKEPAHEVAALQAEAHQEKIAAEDARQALLVAQQKSAEQTSRLDELQEEVKQAQERRLRSDQSAQYKLQVLEDEQEQRSFKSSEDLRRAKEHARAEAAALDQCEMKLESLEKKERTRALFENVQVEFDRKEKQSKEELREATQLRNEAAMAADEALALRVKLMREDQDLQSQKTSLNHLEQQAAQKLEAATGELDRARSLTQELSKDKAEAFQELAEARRTSARAEAERELAHQQSLEAEMAAYEAMKACDAADEDRKKVEAALLQVTEDLERAARSQRQGQDLFAKGEASTQKFQTLEAQASHYSAESRRLAQALATEQAQCKECRSEKDRAQQELRDLSRLTRFALVARFLRVWVTTSMQRQVFRTWVEAEHGLQKMYAAAAQRIGSWASELQKRSVPCLPEQQEVERCYSSPPSGDLLRCGAVVEAYVRCAKA
ncbi:unnamed protein product [Effrenium voratum]|uniref:Uncharacterized protein n=1 Tax=Effrenium voratum TaxID=2562239 RepID=A0AA36JAX8_9DINO|nr:unnamed protein product [Effrenium voratum]